jgi:hypothetical protein
MTINYNDIPLDFVKEPVKKSYTGHFLTSRYGRFNRIKLYYYKFSKRLTENQQVRNTFLNWLKSNLEVVLLRVESNYFVTFNELPVNAQYELSGNADLVFPFENTQLLSSYLSLLIRKHYSASFFQYLNKNIYAFTKTEFHPFSMLKCFSFDVEMFSDGRFFVHYQIQSKIVSNTFVDVPFLNSLCYSLRGSDNINKQDIILVDRYNRFRQRFNLLDRKNVEEAMDFIRVSETRKQEILGTFSIAFLRNYSSDIYADFVAASRPSLSESVKLAVQFSNGLHLPDFIQLNDSPIFSVTNPRKPRLDRNLMIGNGFDAREQKAAFYNGVFRPSHKSVILPIEIGGDFSESFVELLGRFNTNGSTVILPPFKYSAELGWPLSALLDLKAEFGNHFLIAIFMRFKQPSDILKPLQNKGLQIQIYTGVSDSFKMSNFCVKCIEKLGGLLSALKCTFERETTYFIGIDLGHSRTGSERHSNMCVTVFDYKGERRMHRVINKIPLNEALNHSAFMQAMKYIVEFLSMEGFPFPEKFIVHRDGKVHKDDLEIMSKVFAEVAEMTDFDVVEVIKSGYPIFAVRDGAGNLSNPEPGEYFLLPSKKYAILATNTQAGKQGQAVKPVVLRHSYGNTEFTNLIEQIFWFTKVYTNNLYNSTRLPATTELANNRTGTGDKRFVATYLA